MADPWLTIIGVGEDGRAGLSSASLEALERAELVFGGARHLSLCAIDDARARPWPSPFSVDEVARARSRRQPVAILASGDPFWHGVGGTIATLMPPDEWRCLPGPSTFALMAARLGWRVEDVLCLGLHAAPLARLRPHLHDGGRAILLVSGPAQAVALAAYLSDMRFGDSALWVGERLGGPKERLTRHLAFELAEDDAEGFAAPLAVACAFEGAHGLPATSARGDHWFAHEGQITKQPIRALTLAALGPRPGERLWDIGAGSGSIAIEWALAGGSASAIERRADRASLIAANARALGVAHRVEIIDGEAPDAFEGMPAPDAVFLGGGVDRALLEAVFGAAPLARVVGNAVTLETEALFSALHRDGMGDLMRIDIAHAEKLGGFRGWKPSRPIVQWVFDP